MATYFKKSILVCFILFLAPQVVFSCGVIKSRWGPFDYNLPQNYVKSGSYGKGAIPTVTRRHFTNDVQWLTRQGNIAGDLHYTLREVPNHPVALNTASKYEYKLKYDKKFSLKHHALPETFNCYIKRAKHLYPNDANIYLINGIHHYRFKHYQQAVDEYKHALKLSPSNPEIHYNIGLAYFKLNNYQLAKEHEEQARKLGYPLNGLKKMLQKVNMEYNNGK